MKRLLVYLTTLVMVAHCLDGVARDPKELDRDVNYDEQKIPNYDLPPLLRTAEGDEVSTPQEWMTVRRPQIVSLFSNLIYGRVPAPEEPYYNRIRNSENGRQRHERQGTSARYPDSFQEPQGKGRDGDCLIRSEERISAGTRLHETQLQ